MRNSLFSLLAFFTVLLCCHPHSHAQSGQKNNPDVIQVTATYNPQKMQHLFLTETDTVASGWNTFHFTNASPAVHFMILEHLPGDKTKADVEREVGPIFQDAMDLLTEGKTEEGYAKLGELPAWFSKVIFRGGTGLVMPAGQTEITTYLTPGNYALECYIKAEDGTFHSMMGMFRDLYVTKTENNHKEPATADIDVYPSLEGYKIEGDLSPGKHLVAVHFQEDPPGPSAPDVHVIRLNDDTDMEAVTNWIDWSQPKGMISGHKGTSPIPAEFLGGTQEAPKGSTTYFSINLEPGKYALVAEMPANSPIYEEFQIKADQ